MSGPGDLEEAAGPGDGLSVSLVGTVDIYMADDDEPEDVAHQRFLRTMDILGFEQK